MSKRNTGPGWVERLILLSGLVIFAQLAYFTADLLRLGMFSYMLTLLPSSMSQCMLMLWPLLRYVAVVVLLNVVWVMLLWYITATLTARYQWSDQRASLFVALLWLMTTTGLFLANTYYFPNSHFALPTPLWGIDKTGPLILGVLIVIAMVCMAVILYVAKQGYADIRQRHHRFRHGVVCVTLVSIGFVCGLHHLEAMPNTLVADTQTKPNVFLIGLDAVRPDLLSFHTPATKLTPHLDDFLRSAHVFTNAYTPLAKTFPAWMSILTSQYPKHNHIRGNLKNPEDIHLTESLVTRFHDQGYETMYAADDRAWSVIDQHFGFDRIIGPPAYATAFTIALINDFPLSNLVMMSPLGEILFPECYSNHLMSITYEPENFLHQLNTALHYRSGKPLFLAVHFNVSGWPHMWAGEQEPPSDYEAYKKTLRVVDRQFGAYLQSLSANHLLDNALVVVLSDHGTGLGLPGDTVTTESGYQGDKQHIKLYRSAYSVPVVDNTGHPVKRGIDTSYGYGENILSDVAYHTLMAYRGFGVDTGSIKQLPQLTSLLDIAPTVLDLLHMKALSQPDGISLRPDLMGVQPAQEHRSFFMETTLILPELSEAQVNIKQVVKHLGDTVQLDAKGALKLKEATDLAARKRSQKAIAQGDWMLANLPATERYKPTPDHQIVAYLAPPQLILVNLKTRQWTAEMQSPFAQAAPTQTLLAELMRFYGEELNL